MHLVVVIIFGVCVCFFPFERERERERERLGGSWKHIVLDEFVCYTLIRLIIIISLCLSEKEFN
jgi:hypothetical protein